MVERVALYPGTFDPITNGHLDVIGRAARLVDRDEGVAPLVHIGTDDNHEGCLLHCEEGRSGRSADTSQWGRCHAPIKSRRPVLHT